MWTKIAAPLMITSINAHTTGVSAPAMSMTLPANSTTVTNDAEMIASGMLSVSNPSVVRPMPLRISF
ncbi:hypothetical protein GCM10010464_00660 [Pseudonocardia yunnanensis]